MKPQPFKTQQFTKTKKTKTSFEFNPDANSGESLTLTTIMELNEDGDILYDQSLNLQSYGNSASFNLCAANLTPENLRDLASQLEIQKSKLLTNPETA